MYCNDYSRRAGLVRGCRTKIFTVPSGAYFVGASRYSEVGTAIGLFQKRQFRYPAVHKQGSSKLDPTISNPHPSLILSYALVPGQCGAR